MSAEPLGLLISSAQSALADVPTVHDYRDKRVLIQSARVQVEAAQALATAELAAALDRLTVAITQETS